MAAATAAGMDYARRMMVERQIRTWDVLDQRVLDLLESLPRERFVPDRHRNLAYADTEIPLGDGQIMMAPKVEGRMLQALDVQPADSILEIGTGSGFITACLASLGRDVLSCDIRDAFFPGARAALHDLDLDEKVEFRHQDGAKLDWAQRRFDVICVTGSMPVLDPSFADRLEIGGRLFVVSGSAPAMEAMLLTRIDENEWARESLFETVLPPLDNVVLPSPFSF
ncbi:MAG TPA: protein-L-isoaspartate O-methyltransferase [Gammaproteobacteria bacterium]|nr:protein-L-isoaspartate O-methyltransferase [Gammaproteobacteria bacterium]